MAERIRRRELLGAAFIAVVVTLMALAPTLHDAFIYDDTAMIRDNAWLRGWGALARVWGQPYWPTTGPDALGLYRPMHVAMLAAVWNASGGSALAFHVYAVVLAAVTALAVWWLLRRATGAAAAFLVTILFASHPLHVEAVASVANSSELLVVLGTLALVWLLRPERGEPAAGRWTHALLVALVAAATLLSKESGLLALPLALVTAWGWRARGTPAPSMRALLRSERLAIAAACVALALALLARAMVLDAPVARTSIAAQGLGMAWPVRVVAMVSLWPRIAGMLVWPTSLAPYYGPSSFPSATATYAAVAIVAVALLAAVAIRQARRGERRLLVALAWVALTYFPASNVLVATGQIVSDRTLFGATVGVALALAWLVDRWAGRTAAGRVVAVLVVMVLYGSYVTGANRYARAWRTHRALWTHLVAVAPREHLGYKLLGMDARARRDQAGAIDLLARASAMAPADRQIRFELGQALYAGGRYPQAAATLGTLMRDADAQGEPGLVALYLESVGRTGGAAGVVTAARPLLRTPAAATAALYLGMAHERLGHPAGADSAYAAGLAASPRDTTLQRRRAGLGIARPRHGS